MRWLDNLFQHRVVAARSGLPIFIYRSKLSADGTLQNDD